MNSSKQFKSKLASYGVVTGAFLAVGSVAQGQVLYTDENPDAYYTGSGPNYHGIDMNGDATDEFTLNQSIATSVSVYTTNYGAQYSYTNSWNYVGISKNINSFGITGSASNVCSVLNSGDVVGPTGLFNVENLAYNIGSDYSGNFQGAGDKYIGVKYNDGANDFYGWILINVDAASAGLTVKGYGFETQAGVPIHAGDTIGVYTDSIMVSNITSAAADAAFHPSAAGTTYYVVQPQTDVMPSPAEVVSGTGSSGATVPSSGNKTVAPGVNDIFNLTGLSAQTDYAIYVVIVDTSGITSLVDSVPFTTLSTVGIDENISENFNVYPIPASNALSVELNTAGTVVVRDLSGKEISRYECLAGHSDIDISSFEVGTYIIEHLTNGCINRMKFIKQ